MNLPPVTRSSSDRAAAFVPRRAGALRAAAALILVALLALAWRLHATPGRGAPAALSLLLGLALGIVFEGISAFAVAGWVFAAATLGGVWLGIRLRLHTWGE
jgi:hypothetical protein